MSRINILRKDKTTFDLDIGNKVPRGTMSKRTIRVRLADEHYRKYKVFCAINDVSMTQQTENIVREFIVRQNENIKIINTARV